MSNTLTKDGTTLVLPPDLLWVDEFAWKQVEQRTQYTITGALLVESTSRQAGRNITLAGDVDQAWMPRATLAALQAWCAIPAAAMSLVLRGEAARNVVWDHAAGPIEASPVSRAPDVLPEDYYRVTLHFIEV